MKSNLLLNHLFLHWTTGQLSCLSFHDNLLRLHYWLCPFRRYMGYALSTTSRIVHDLNVLIANGNVKRTQRKRRKRSTLNLTPTWRSLSSSDSISRCSAQTHKDRLRPLPLQVFALRTLTLCFIGVVIKTPLPDSPSNLQVVTM